MGWSIQPTSTNLVSLTLLGRFPIRVQPPLVEAVQAMELALVLHHYEDPCDFIGSWHYRSISGTGGLFSGHAYAVCIDLDYGGDTDGDGDPTIDSNPHIHRAIIPGDPGFGVEWQITEAQVRAIEAIRTTDGLPVWSWRIGWKLGDTMHWQPLQGPDIGAIDWSTVQGPDEIPEPPPEEETMPDLDTFIHYIRKVDVEKMGLDRIIKPAEVAYYTSPSLWVDDDTKVPGKEADWQNLFNAYQVRSPIWAV
jgi:hypothetical protein